MIKSSIQKINPRKPFLRARQLPSQLKGYLWKISHTVKGLPLASWYFIKKIQQNIEEMQFLKKKAQIIVSRLRPRKDANDLAPSALLNAILSSDNEGAMENGLLRLAELSHKQENYEPILERLTAVLSDFTYKLKTLRITAKALTVATVLLKAGKSSFCTDFKAKEEMLAGLEGVDVHHFDATHPSEKKELEYRLQLIKQRAAFLRKLLHDSSLLEMERGKIPRSLEMREHQSQNMTATSLFTPSHSPNKQNFKVKFQGVQPASQLQELPFDQLAPKSKNSSRF